MQGSISVPQAKVRDLQVRGRQMTNLGWVSAKQLASVIGKILVIGLALSLVARLMTRSLYELLNTRSAWCNTLRITPEATNELQFWG